jgi:hypothetical protein
MASRWAWPARALKYVAPVILASLVVQYLLGLYTNLYGGFSATTSTGALDGHYTNGDILFLLAVLALIFASLARDWKNAGLGAALVAIVTVAGFMGGAFQNSVANVGDAGQPVYSFAMGVLFLVGLFVGVLLVYFTWGPSRTSSAGSAVPASPTG